MTGIATQYIFLELDMLGAITFRAEREANAPHAIIHLNLHASHLNRENLMAVWKLIHYIYYPRATPELNTLCSQKPAHTLQFGI